MKKETPYKGYKFLIVKMRFWQMCLIKRQTLIISAAQASCKKTYLMI